MIKTVVFNIVRLKVVCSGRYLTPVGIEESKYLHLKRNAQIQSKEKPLKELISRFHTPKRIFNNFFFAKTNV